jgi:hypothetical protein
VGRGWVRGWGGAVVRLVGGLGELVQPVAEEFIDWDDSRANFSTLSMICPGSKVMQCWGIRARDVFAVGL